MTAPHSLCYVEIPSTDLGASKAFYEAVFGWTVRGGDGYAEFTFPAYGSDAASAGVQLSGGLTLSRKPHLREEGPVLYLACDDIEATLDQVASAGGTRAREKTQIGEEHGFYALFRDPSGNLLGIWSRA